MLRRIGTLGALLALTCWTAAAIGADVAAGKAKAETACGECHEAADWEGEDVESLKALIRDVASGAVKHKKSLDLTEAEISNIAAYWATGGG